MESNTLHWSTVHRCQEALDALDQLETQQADIAKLIEAGGAMKNAIDHLIQVENSTEDDDGRFGLDDLNGAWSSVGKYCKAWDAAKSAAPAQQPKRLTDEEIERAVRESIPEMSHVGLAPNDAAALKMARAFMERGLRYARDNGYIGGLSVDDAVKVAYDWFEGPIDNGPGSDYDKLRARLTAKLQGK
jgi:hypothetical protein